jgi:hypothetical protein
MLLLAAVQVYVAAKQERRVWAGGYGLSVRRDYAMRLRHEEVYYSWFLDVDPLLMVSVATPLAAWVREYGLEMMWLAFI